MFMGLFSCTRRHRFAQGIRTGRGFVTTACSEDPSESLSPIVVSLEDEIERVGRRLSVPVSSERITEFQSGGVTMAKRVDWYYHRKG